MSASPKPADAKPLSAERRTLISLLLFMHLFCIFIAMGGMVFRSELVSDLRDVVSPYTKTFHLDPDFVPFHLTSGEDGFTRLHQWQVIEDGKISSRLPAKAWKAGFNRARQDMYARVGAFYASNEDLDSEVSIAMTKALAVHYLAVSPNSKQFLVRCVRYVGDADPLSANIDNDSVFSVFEADVWLTEGKLNVLQREEPRRLAPPVSSDRQEP